MGTSYPKTDRKIHTGFYARVPNYSYEMPCGQVFRSKTPSVASDVDGRHWFPCRPSCRDAATGVWGYHSFTDFEVLGKRGIERRPREAGEVVTTMDARRVSRVIGETTLIKRLDDAMIRDRIADRLTRGEMGDTAADIARDLGVHVSTVWTVGLEIGVYQPHEKEVLAAA